MELTIKPGDELTVKIPDVVRAQLDMGRKTVGRAVVVEVIQQKRLTPDQLQKLRVASLDFGLHKEPALRPSKKDQYDEYEKGVCVMELVSFLTGQEHTDTPMCVSGVIRDCMVDINDSAATQAERNKLKRLVPEVIGTLPVLKVEFQGFVFTVPYPRDLKEIKAIESARLQVLKEWQDKEDKNLSEIGYRGYSQVIRRMAAIEG